MSNENSIEEFEALTTGAGFVQLNDACWLKMTGDDRKKQLHSFCTNEINGLEPGQIAEAFILNTKGKTIGLVQALNGSESLDLFWPAGDVNPVMNHLDMYVIREDVRFTDESASLATVFVCGDTAIERLESFVDALPGEKQFLLATSSELQINIAHVEVAGFGFLLTVPSEQAEDLRSLLTSNGISECSLESLHVVRITKGTPWFGLDLNESNLPQELQRDEKSISFEKGCYLGQETVARIDALGRVNQLFVRMELNESLEGDLPCEILVDEKPAAKITSFAHSPAGSKWIAIGYVRRKYKEPGTQIGNAVVVG